MTWLRTLFSRKAAKTAKNALQVDLSFATNKELMEELFTRSETIVIIQTELVNPDKWALYAGGNDPSTIRTATLVGMCRVAEKHLIRMMHARPK